MRCGTRTVRNPSAIRTTADRTDSTQWASSSIDDCALIVALIVAVFPNGEVCISILHPPGEDPMRYESHVERWSPVQSVEKILISVVSMLAGTSITNAPSFRAVPMLDPHEISLLYLCNPTEPNDESGANIEAAVCIDAEASGCNEPIKPNLSDANLMSRLSFVMVQKMWRENRELYNQMVLETVRKSLLS